MLESPLVILLVAIIALVALVAGITWLDHWHRRRAWRQAHTETEREFRRRRGDPP